MRSEKQLQPLAKVSVMEWLSTATKGASLGSVTVQLDSSR
jgi:hypothetical protein